MFLAGPVQDSGNSEVSKEPLTLRWSFLRLGKADELERLILSPLA